MASLALSAVQLRIPYRLLDSFNRSKYGKSEKNLYAAQQAVISVSGTYKAIEAQLRNSKSSYWLARGMCLLSFLALRKIIKIPANAGKEAKYLQTLQKEHNELQIFLTRTAAEATMQENICRSRNRI
jgi:hypothetical protein